MATLRSEEQEAKFQQHRKDNPNEACAICAKPVLKQFKHWKIIQNEFPYDRIASVHHMVVPMRHVTEHELTQEEWVEYQTIKNSDIANAYHYMIEATPKQKSIPAHFHVHLIVLK